MMGGSTHGGSQADSSLQLVTVLILLTVLFVVQGPGHLLAASSMCTNSVTELQWLPCMKPCIYYLRNRIVWYIYHV